MIRSLRPQRSNAYLVSVLANLHSGLGRTEMNVTERAGGKQFKDVELDTEHEVLSAGGTKDQATSATL